MRKDYELSCGRRPSCFRSTVGRRRPSSCRSSLADRDGAGRGADHGGRGETIGPSASPRAREALPSPRSCSTTVHRRRRASAAPRV